MGVAHRCFRSGRQGRVQTDLVLTWFWIATGLVTPRKRFYPPPLGEGSFWVWGVKKELRRGVNVCLPPLRPLTGPLNRF